MVLKLCITLVGILIITFQSCSKITKYDEDALTFKNKFVFDNQFNVNGMYLSLDQENPEYHYLIYFFQNGTYFEAVVKNLDISTCYMISNESRKVPYRWGWFIVDEHVIKVQTLDPTSWSAGNEYKVHQRWYQIQNDITINEFKYIDRNGKMSDVDRVYSLKHCYPKPDSTNILMD